MFELAQTGDLSSADASTLTASGSQIQKLVDTEAMSFEWVSADGYPYSIDLSSMLQSLHIQVK